MTGYAPRVKKYRRAGLIYEPLEDHPGTWCFRPDGPFTVDGIEYDHNLHGVYVSRFMCEELEWRETGAHSTFQITRPPTEDELDDWVRTGYMTR